MLWGVKPSSQFDAGGRNTSLILSYRNRSSCRSRITATRHISALGFITTLPFFFLTFLSSLTKVVRRFFHFLVHSPTECPSPTYSQSNIELYPHSNYYYYYQAHLVSNSFPRICLSCVVFKRPRRLVPYTRKLLYSLAKFLWKICHSLVLRYRMETRRALS